VSIIEKKLIDAYTILLMAEEVLEENIPDTIISNGKTLREEVILEQARRITGIVPEPVDNKILDRLNDLEGTLDALLGGE
jgi:hypothetical protein